MAGLFGKRPLEVTDLRFNTPLLKQTMAGAKRKFLYKSGAYVRTSARSLLRPSKRISSPGEPPNSPTKRLRGSIFYAVEEGNGKADCVIGPTRLNSTNRHVRTNGIPISRVLEQGGQVLIEQEQYYDGTWHRVGLRNRPNGIRVTLPKRWVKISVLARPFMRPALLTNKPKFAGMWRGLFKKG